MVWKVTNKLRWHQKALFDHLNSQIDKLFDECFGIFPLNQKLSSDFSKGNTQKASIQTAGAATKRNYKA
jgi:hypothetical protein